MFSALTVLWGHRISCQQAPTHWPRTLCRIAYLHIRPTQCLYTNDTSKPATRDTPSQTPDKGQEPWRVQKNALQKKFGKEGWQPRKRLSPDAIEGIRALHARDPEFYSTPYLANHFKVSPEAIRRILKSKWRPTDAELEKQRQRWKKRGEAIWAHWSELGLKPPKKWRSTAVDPTADNSSEDLPSHEAPATGDTKMKHGSSLSNRIL